MTAPRCVVLALLAAACGGGASGTHDAAPADAALAPDARADASPDAAPPDAAAPDAGPDAAAVGLTINPPAADFGTVTAGQGYGLVFTVHNLASAATGPLTVTVSGAFHIDDAGSTCAGALPAADSCRVLVVFAPTSSGPAQGTLTATGSPGGAAAADLTGMGQVGLTVTRTGAGTGTVTSAPAGIACGATCSAAFAGGPVTLTAAPAPGSWFAGFTGCTDTPTPTTCTVALDAPDRQVGARFEPGFQLTVVKQPLRADATGSVTAIAPPLDCGPTCASTSTTAAPGTTVVLTATPSPGFAFAGWGGACSGSATCTVVLDRDRQVTAAFTPYNVMFVTSQEVAPGQLGGIAGADALCNNLAGATGSRLAANTHYRAWLASATVHAGDDLLTAAGTPARGWVRPDGKPFADTLTAIWNGQLVYPPRIDERGNDVGAGQVAATGADYYGNDGNVDGNCGGWTSATGGALAGQPSGGWGVWTSSASARCDLATSRIYCLGVDYDVALVVPPTPGRHAFLSTGYMGYLPGGGVAGADALCNSQGQTAFGSGRTFKALLATSTFSAASRFRTDRPAWVRWDGVPVVKQAADLFDPTKLLEVPIDATASGQVYTSYLAFTGATAPDQLGDGSCSDWTASTGMLTNGITGNTDHTWFYLPGGGGFTNRGCRFAIGHIYCLEE